MLRATTLFAAALLTTPAPALPAAAAEPAEAAAQEWSIGGSFQIGDVFFRVGFHDAQYHRGVYVRAERPIPGHHHYALCFERGGHLYHHPTCPLVRGYFDQYGYSVEQVLYVYRPSLPVVYGTHPGRGRGKGLGARKPGKNRLKVPPGHYPPPGLCRIWYPGIPPGHQPAPVSCVQAYRWAPFGSVVVDGGAY